jgi:hypothetical protein
MEILLIDIGGLGIFLGYVAVVYWHAVSHDPRTPGGTRPELGHGPTPGRAARADLGHPDCESARARSARSSVAIGQRSSQLMQ